MVTQISDKKIMTSWDARTKHEDYYIGFIITEENKQPEESRGYPVYLAETEDEAFTEVGKYNKPETDICVLPGHNADGASLGGMCLE